MYITKKKHNPDTFFFNGTSTYFLRDFNQITKNVIAVILNKKPNKFLLIKIEFIDQRKVNYIQLVNPGGE